MGRSNSLGTVSKSPRKAKPEFYWWMFPITGITITDLQGNLDAPIFGDATVISKSAFEQLVRDHNESLTKMTESMLSSTEIDSFIAVRLPLLSFDGDKESTAAEERFDELIAVLTLFIAEKRNFGFACGPAHSTRHRLFQSVCISESTKNWRGSFENRHHLFFDKKGIELNRAQLISELQSSSMAKVGDVLFSGSRKNIHSSLTEAISLALRRFAGALYSNLNGDIVASVVACCEILLHPTNVKDEVVKDRLGVVVGFETDVVKQLYDHRNNWIHGGIVPPKKFVKKSILLGVCIIQYFAEIAVLAPKGTSHQELLQWVDLHVFVKKQPKPDELRKLWKHFSDRDPLNPQK